MLLPALLSSRHSRVINVSSTMHSSARAAELSKALMVEDYDNRTPETTYGQ